METESIFEDYDFEDEEDDEYDEDGHFIPQPKWCYHNCFTYMLMYEDHRWTLVHGEIELFKGCRIGHAWLENDTEVYDPTWYTITPKDEWVAKWKANLEKIYTFKEANALTLKNGHSGPWE